MVGYYCEVVSIESVSYSLEPQDSWPLPGQVDPNLTPCALCRRRLLVHGKPVFTSCSCKTDGPRATVAKLAAWAVVFAVGMLWVRRRK